MSDGFAQIPPDSTGKKVDAASLDVGAASVLRQRMIIADNSATAQYAVVTGGALLTTGTFNISAMPAVNVNGGVAISGTAVVSGNVNISTMPAVTGLVGLTAGTSVIGDINAISRTVQVAIGTPFTINNISATVVVSGAIGLTAGSSVIGDINAISRTVQVAIGTPFILQGISTTVTCAVTNGILISAMPAVTGLVGLTAGTAVIGDINAISRTVQVAVGTPFTLNNISANVTTQLGPPAIMSASHGPKCVTASTSANVTLIASPGTGFSIYITQLMCSNAGATGSRARIGTSSSPVTICAFMASAGGGFVMNFDPPWKLSASEAAICSVKPNTADGLFTVNFYVAA